MCIFEKNTPLKPTVFGHFKVRATIYKVAGHRGRQRLCAQVLRIPVPRPTLIQLQTRSLLERLFITIFTTSERTVESLHTEGRLHARGPDCSSDVNVQKDFVFKDSNEQHEAEA